MIVHFESVGRWRKCWSETLPESVDAILQAVKRKRFAGQPVLRSSASVEVVSKEDGQGGLVLAGAHVVGHYRIEWEPGRP